MAKKKRPPSKLSPPQPPPLKFSHQSPLPKATPTPQTTVYVSPAPRSSNRWSSSFSPAASLSMNHRSPHLGLNSQRAKAFANFEKEDLHDRTASMNRMRFSSCSMVSTLTPSEPPLPPEPPDPPDASSSLFALIIGVVLYGSAASSDLHPLLSSVGAGRLCTILEFVSNGSFLLSVNCELCLDDQQVVCSDEKINPRISTLLLDSRRAGLRFREIGDGLINTNLGSLVSDSVVLQWTFLHFQTSSWLSISSFFPCLSRRCLVSVAKFLAASYALVAAAFSDSRSLNVLWASLAFIFSCMEFVFLPFYSRVISDIGSTLSKAILLGA